MCAIRRAGMRERPAAGPKTDVCVAAMNPPSISTLAGGGDPNVESLLGAPQNTRAASVLGSAAG